MRREGSGGCCGAATRRGPGCAPWRGSARRPPSGGGRGGRRAMARRGLKRASERESGRGVEGLRDSFMWQSPRGDPVRLRAVQTARNHRGGSAHTFQSGFGYPDVSLGLRLGSAHAATIRGPTASRGRGALCDLPAPGLGSGARGQGSQSERPEVTGVWTLSCVSGLARTECVLVSRTPKGGQGCTPNPASCPRTPPREQRGAHVLTARCAPHAAVTASGPNLAPPSAATTRGSSRAPPCGHMPPPAPPRAPCLTLLLVVPSESPRGPLVPPLPPGGAAYSQGLQGRCRSSLPAGRTGLRQGDSATAQLRPSDPRPRVSQALRPAADLPRAPEARASPRPPSARRAQSGRPRPCPREQTRGPVRGDASRGESAAERPARTPNFITRKSLRNALGAWGAGWETAQGER